MVDVGFVLYLDIYCCCCCNRYGILAIHIWSGLLLHVSFTLIVAA